MIETRKQKCDVCGGYPVPPWGWSGDHYDGTINLCKRCHGLYYYDPDDGKVREIATKKVVARKTRVNDKTGKNKVIFIPPSVAPAPYVDPDYHPRKVAGAKEKGELLINMPPGQRATVSIRKCKDPRVKCGDRYTLVVPFVPLGMEPHGAIDYHVYLCPFSAKEMARCPTTQSNDSARGET